MTTSLRWTSADLEVMPDDGKRREIIDGELYVSRQPNWFHQVVCVNGCNLLQLWSNETGLGQATIAPGLIFADDDDVAPDVVWISNPRFAKGLDAAGHLRVPPELVVEVLAPGAGNERRDREAKLKLYSRRGVDEYWIVDWQTRSVSVFRRAGEPLQHAITLAGNDVLTTPLLPGFAASVDRFFAGLPALTE